MTSRITHEKLLPKNIAYWDYYILCRLNMTAALALQRMEYWDGTKADGNIHSERINEHLEAAGKPATQDTSRFVYKSHEELSWELIGCCCERTLPKVVDMLLSQLRYLTWRKNPYNTLDHTRQYCFQAKLVQSHLDRLSDMVKHFLDLGRMSVPVLYAIEQLTAEGYYIAQMAEKDAQVFERTDVELLSIERIASKLAVMHKQMHEDEREAQPVKAAGKKFTHRLPRFVRTELKKDEAHGFSAENAFRDGKIAVSEPQNCRLGTAKLPEGDGKVAGTIPVITTVITNTHYEGKGDTGTASSTVDAPPTDLPRALAVQVAEQAAELARLKALLAEKEHVIQQLQQATQQPTPATLPTQPVEPEQATQQQEHVITLPSNPISSAPSSSTPQLSKAPSQCARTHQGKPTSSSKQGASTLAEPPPVIDGDMQHRIDEMFGRFDALRRIVTNKPRCYGRTASATTAIYELLASHPLPLEKGLLEQVYLALWEEPENKQTHYHQRNHMTIESVCKQFDRKLIALEAQETRTAAEPSVGGYHYWKPPQEDDGELVYAGPKAKGKRG